MSTETTKTSSLPWQPYYWAFAAIPGMVPFAFEAAKLSFFEVTRAPNVSLITQLVLLLLFYSVFIFVPRIAWRITLANVRESSSQIATRLVAFGLLSSALHLLMLTFILLAMYSAPGWGTADLIQSFFEVWLGNVGLWLIVYAAVCALIVIHLKRSTTTHPEPVRLEVRHGNRTIILALAEIAWIEANGNYVNLHTQRGSFLLRKSLSALEKELHDAGFLRAHRRALVNASKVLSVQRHHEHGYEVELTNEFTAPLSRRRLNQFKQLLTHTAVTSL